MSSRDIVFSAAGAGGDVNYIEDVFSTWLYTGNGSTQTIPNNIQLGDASVIASQSATALPTSTNRSYQFVAAGNGIFVAQAYFAAPPFASNYYATSTDGVTWTNQTNLPASYLWYGLAFANGVFVMTTQYDGSAEKAIYSSDGLSWNTASGYPTNYLSAGVYVANGEFFSINNDVTNFGQTIYRSSTGTSWSSVSVNAGASSQYRKIAYGAGIYILTGNANTVYSSNLSSWTLNSVGVLSDIAYGAGRFIGVASNQLKTSTDGINWTTVQASGFSVDNITFNGSLFLGSDNSGNLYWSADGLSWTSNSTVSTTILRNATLAGKTVFIGTGNGARSAVVVNSFVPSSLGNGGLVWIKDRNSGAKGHALFDTARGVNKKLQTQSTTSSSDFSGQLTNFNADGFTLGSAGDINSSSTLFCSWTFAKQPKFFDVVTYTGDGAAERQVNHSLGSAPGMVIVKSTSNSTNWAVWHRSLGATSNNMYLNLTAANGANADFSPSGSGTMSSTSFCVSSTLGLTNASGQTYVAYLFAHNAGGFGLTGADNVISCGSFTTNGSGNATVNLGYEPQYILFKYTSTSPWYVFDAMRGFSLTSQSALFPNTASVENTYTGTGVFPTATGFSTLGTAVFDPNATIIYMAIRRPMKVPTTGTSVYQANAYTGNGTANTTVAGNFGFPVDLMLLSSRTANATAWSSYAQLMFDRLRGNDVSLSTSVANAEASGWNGYQSLIVPNNIGWGLYGSSSGSGFVNNTGGTWVARGFRRSPGFFDEVCYTGTGSARTVAHNLTVAPELMIIKRRNAVESWYVYGAPMGNTIAGILNSNMQPFTTDAAWNNTSPTSTVFTVNTEGGVNANGGTYVAYLFATCLNVSKVGSYTGTGATQTINCGFTGGARFVLIKRTNSSGGWYVWDTARGMVAGTDPFLALNTASAESNINTVYTITTGFQIVGTDPELNASGSTYIFLAIA